MSWELRLYRLRMVVLDDVQARMRAAWEARDLRGIAEQHCERAWVEMALRDLWKQGSERWKVWDAYMRADVERAELMAGLPAGRAA
jgi:hypothetical protein